MNGEDFLRLVVCMSIFCTIWLDCGFYAKFRSKIIMILLDILFMKKLCSIYIAVLLGTFITARIFNDHPSFDIDAKFF